MSTGYVFGAKSCHCAPPCALDGPYTGVEGGVNTNRPSTACCAYLTFSDIGLSGPVTATVPVGINGTWAWAGEPLPANYFNVTSAFGDRSIGMTVGTDAYVLIHLDENCCPESIEWESESGQVTDMQLHFGPVVIPDYFAVDYASGIKYYDLYICETATAGACCKEGELTSLALSEFECEFNSAFNEPGDGPGAWREDGTYDPEDPCSDDPFP